MISQLNKIWIEFRRILNLIETAVEELDKEKQPKDLTTLDNDTPLDADVFSFWDVVDSVRKKITWANTKATLKTYFDSLYQAVLVSGTNIKTINNESLLGSGNIEISGGGGGGVVDNDTLTGEGTAVNPFRISDEYKLRINAGI